MLKDSTILITGGTGSIGMELCRQLLTYEPHAVRLLSNSEDELHRASSEVDKSKVRLLEGDIRDKDRLSFAMKGVDYVFHLAALKHVDLCEYYPIETIKTNIIGSLNIVECSLENNVKNCLAVSTDKAASPTSIYGATKLTMEFLFTCSNSYVTTQFSCVRLGNCLNSRGSLLSVVHNCIENNKPVPVTNYDMTRWVISLEDAAKFIIDSFNVMQGGEIFIPKMKQCSVRDMLSGILPEGYPVKIIGIRDGEKMSELLYTADEKIVEYENYCLIKKNPIL